MQRISHVGVLLAVFVSIALSIQASAAQGALDDESKAVVQAMLTQTGLHLSGDTPDILTLITKQGAQTACDEIDVKWVSLPGQKSLLTPTEACQLRLPQSFSLLTRRVFPQCDPKSYRTWLGDLRYSRLIVFGTTQDSEIRGLDFGRDPREMIAECPELFGGKSTPETRCGILIDPEAIANLIIPRDPALTRLVFFFRTFTGREQWHLERLGELELSQSKP